MSCCMQRMDYSEEYTCGLCKLDLNFNRKAEMKWIWNLNVAPQLGHVREGKAQNSICPHNKETWAVSESGNAVLRKWFLLRSERCWGGHQVRQREYSREKAFIKSFSHVWEYKWEEQNCQDWTLNEYNLLGKTYANWTVNTRWNMISSVKEIRSSFAEHRKYFPVLGY